MKGAPREVWTLEASRDDLQRQIACQGDAFATRLDDLKILLMERHQAMNTAVITALASTDKRFEGVNEFRAQLADQTATYITRAEASALFTASSAALAADHDRLAEMVPRGEMKLQLDAMATQVAAIQKSITDTTQLLAATRSRDAGRNSGTADALEAAERAAEAGARNRSLIITSIGVLVTASALIIGLLLGLRHAPTTVGGAPLASQTGIHAPPQTTALP